METNFLTIASNKKVKVAVPFEIVAEEGEGGVGENGRIGFALIDELFQFFHFQKKPL